MDATERIKEMEARMDEVRAALDAVEAAEGSMLALMAYYDSGQWRQDYEADEAGVFPPELKRGVLSQDGLWNLICDWQRIRGKE